jgi:L-malate glycosyltransferase
MSERGHKIVISGYYGFGNMGDEAILSAMVKSLRLSMRDPQIVVLSNNLEHTSRAYNVRAVQRRNPFILARELINADLFISGGGGLIQDTTGVSTIEYYLGLVLIALLMRRKVLFYAQGIGPIQTEKGKKYTRFVANKVSCITIRDEESRTELRKMGVHRPPMIVTADPVLALEPAEEPLVSEILQKESIDMSRMRIAISIRPWKATNDYVKHVACAAKKLRDDLDAEIVLIPFQHSQDMEVCEAVLAHMEGRAKLVRGTYEPEIMQGLMGKMDLIIGMRLHSLIFGSTVRVPMIGLVYDPKVRIFSESVKIPFILLEELDAERLSNLAKSVYNSREEVVGRLGEQLASLKERAQSTAEIARILIEGGPLPVAALEEAS